MGFQTTASPLRTTLVALRVAAKKRRLSARGDEPSIPRSPVTLTRPPSAPLHQPAAPAISVGPPPEPLARGDQPRPALRLSAPVLDLTRDTGEIGQSVKAKLTEVLKRRIRDAFKAPSEALVDAIDELEIDLDSVRELPFREFLTNNVVLKLLDDPELSEHLYRSGLNTRADEEQTVSALLGMDRNPRDVEALSGIVRKIRNTEIASVAGLRPEVAAAITDIDVADNPSALREFIQSGTMTPGERDEVILAAKLARLTDDNFEAVRALKERGVNDAPALITMRHDDWIELIVNNGIQPPEGETVESYAELLETSVERSMPGVFAAARFTSPDPRRNQALNGLTILDRITTGDDAIFQADGTVRTNLGLEGLAEDDAASIRKSLADLNALGNRIGARDILNHNVLSTTEKRLRLEKRLSAIEAVFSARPTLDIAKANFAGLKGALFRDREIDLAEVPDEERPHVRRALMGLQRATHLTRNYDEADRLMAAGTRYGRQDRGPESSERLAERTGLPIGRARDVYTRAINMRLHTSHVVNAIEDFSGHRRFDPQALYGYTERRGDGCGRDARR